VTFAHAVLQKLCNCSQHCDIPEITLWISGLFLIVFLAFIMLACAYVFHTSVWQGNIGKNTLDNSHLDGIFVISIDCL